MSVWTPALVTDSEPTTGRAPEAALAPDADLTGGEDSEPATASGTCFLMTNGRVLVGGDVSRKEAERDGGGWATMALRLERGGMVGTYATGGGGTRAYMRGRRFSLPP